MKENSILQLYYHHTKNIIYNALPRTLEADYAFGPHCHQNVELCAMTSGSCVFVVNGEAISVCAGQLLVIFSHMIHSARTPAQAGAQFLQLHFNPECFSDTDPTVTKGLKFVQALNDARNAYLLIDCSAQLFSCMERICAEMANTEDLHHVAVANIYVVEFIFLLSREMEDSYRKVFRIENPLAVQAVRFIGDHEGDRIMVGDVAKACNVTPRYISQIFKQYVNISIADYISISKIDQAMRYIIAGNLDMTKIASKLGFSSAQYFATVFKKYTGDTPSFFKMQIASGRQKTAPL
ncbi:MAG: AraC family transcriptional regulator [Oscillospiraceae bacterium]